MSSSSDIDKKSNLHMYIIYTLLICLIVGMGYIYYLVYKKQSDYETKADLSANYESKSDLSSLITTGSTTGTVKIPGTGGLLSYLPAYGSWYGGSTLASGGAISWIVNNKSGITAPVGIIYNSSNGSFTFTYPGLYKVSFNSYEAIDSAQGTDHNYCIKLALNGTTGIGEICSSNNSSNNYISSHIDNIVRITNSTDYLQTLITYGHIPIVALLSIHWIGL